MSYGRPEPARRGVDKAMKTLYISDLDGTLLRSDERISEYTAKVINKLVENGMLFSYATARSWQTAHKVTSGLTAKIPVIIYNGAFILDNVTQKILLENYFKQKDAKRIAKELIQQEISPIVYTMLEGAEKFSYLKGAESRGMKIFLSSRQGDVRENPVDSRELLYQGNMFYFTCIDEEEKLRPVYEMLKTQYHCVFQKDIYSGEQWLEIMPPHVSKSQAALQLKKYLNCDRIVAFGDGKNDIELFQAADEGYAVENAHDCLKEIAAGIIQSNNCDGVAAWLEEHFEKK